MGLEKNRNKYFFFSNMNKPHKYRPRKFLKKKIGSPKALANSQRFSFVRSHKLFKKKKKNKNKNK